MWVIAGFGPTDPNTVNNIALQKGLELMHDVFGPDLDAAIVTEVADKDVSKCQVAVAKNVWKCQDAKLKAFFRSEERWYKARVRNP